MTATIELPSDQKEAALILEILKRFNVPVFQHSKNDFLEADYKDEHLAILNDRWEEMNNPETPVYSLEDVESILSDRFN
jgi:hypothetical protein